MLFSSNDKNYNCISLGLLGKTGMLLAIVITESHNGHRKNYR